MKKIFAGVLAFVVLCLIGCGCKDSGIKEARTLGELAYDENIELGYTVYLKENDTYVPYLVLTSDYNEHALLLRKELLEENHVFHEDGYGYASYYKDSAIDRFLNEEFVLLLEPKIQEEIVESEIVITAKESIGKAGEETELIERKVFLLSYAELCFTLFGATLKEGEALSYFDNPENRIGYKNGVVDEWLLRSPNVCWFNMVLGINKKGGCGGAAAEKAYGVRPAFCLSNTLGVELCGDIVEGETVYVIKNAGYNANIAARNHFGGLLL